MLFLKRMLAAWNRSERERINENWADIERGFSAANTAINTAQETAEDGVTRAKNAQAAADDATKIANGIDGKATEALNKSNQAVSTSNTARDTAQQAKETAEYVQSQLDDVAVSGDNIEEVVQARGGKKNLRERLDSEFERTSQLEVKSLKDANSKTYLKIPVYNNPRGHQSTHPSTVSFTTAYKNYLYWMAHTPYEAANDALENPSIVVSNDGVNWIDHPDIPNPLVEQPDGVNMYYSDTELIHNAALDCLDVYYRRVKQNDLPWEEAILRKRITFDGNKAVVGQEELIVSNVSGTSRFLSPCLDIKDGVTHFWSNDSVNKKLHWYTLDNTTLTFVKSLDHPNISNSIWHMGMKFKKDSDDIEMYYCNGAMNEMRYAVLSNNEWITDELVMKSKSGGIDERRIYRPHLSDKDGIRRIYYGTTDRYLRWYIGLSYATPDNPTALTGYDMYAPYQTLDVTVPKFNKEVQIVSNDDEPYVKHFNDGIQYTKSGVADVSLVPTFDGQPRFVTRQGKTWGHVPIEAQKLILAASDSVKKILELYASGTVALNSTFVVGEKAQVTIGDEFIKITKSGVADFFIIPTGTDRASAVLELRDWSTNGSFLPISVSALHLYDATTDVKHTLQYRNNRLEATDVNGRNQFVPLHMTGTTSERPMSNLYIGREYYDQTLKKPVWWSGSDWRDAMGTVV